MAESKRERSKAYPQHTLEDMVSAIQRVYEQLGSGPYSRDSIAEALGHKPGSGTANGKAAALAHYGFLERQHNAYHLSPIAKQLLHPTSDLERAEALVEAVKSPSLFIALFEKFGGKSLPAMLPNILTRDYGITSRQSGSAADIFRESAEYAGLLTNGILRSDALAPEESQESVECESQVDQAASTGSNNRDPQGHKPSVKNQHLGGNASYTIPLSRQRDCQLSVPRPLSEGDIEKIKGWLALMADVLTEPLDGGSELKNPEA